MAHTACTRTHTHTLSRHRAPAQSHNNWPPTNSPGDLSLFVRGVTRSVTRWLPPPCQSAESARATEVSAAVTSARIILHEDGLTPAPVVPVLVPLAVQLTAADGELLPESPPAAPPTSAPPGLASRQWLPDQRRHPVAATESDDTFLVGSASFLGDVRCEQRLPPAGRDQLLLESARQSTGPLAARQPPLQQRRETSGQNDHGTVTGQPTARHRQPEMTAMSQETATGAASTNRVTHRPTTGAPTRRDDTLSDPLQICHA